MKPFLLFLIPFCLFISITFTKSFAQEGITGLWEGVFMDQFKTLIHIKENENKEYFSRIEMYAGENRIQNDEITQLKLSNLKISFLIPAKETSFNGNITEALDEISGNFRFPDGSLHAIKLKKNRLTVNASKKYADNKERVFSHEELNSDLDFLYSSLKENHPSLRSQETLGSLWLSISKLKQSIKSPLDLKSFYLLASQITDKVHCSHTGLRMPVNYQNLMEKDGNYFPLRLFFDKYKVYYISNLGKDQRVKIQAGDEIISINNRSIEEISSLLFYCIPAEGSNLTTKYNGLNKRFNELFCLLEDTEQFDVKFKSKNSIQTITVQALSKEQIDQSLHSAPGERSVIYSYQETHNLGILEIPSFAIKNMDAYFLQLDQIFKDLKTKEIQNLVLDLRNNSGGHPIFAAQLLSYLVYQDFIYFQRNEEVKDFEPLYNSIKANDHNFKGNIYVFINGGCLSTTGHLISLLKYHTDAKFIGEDPGSTFSCNDFSKKLILPNTKLELNVPTTIFITAVDGNAKKIPFPMDYQIRTTKEDIIQGKDPYLEILKSMEI